MRCLRSRSLAPAPLLGAALVVLSACAAEAPPGDGASGCESEEACASSASALGDGELPFTVSQLVQPARYPVVLHHGFNASRTNSWSFNHVKEALEADGDAVTVSEVEPFAGVATRAKRLATYVDAAIASACATRSLSADACARTMKVNLVAHSMGGLDARYLAATLGYASKIATITTISTPHRGSGIADVGLGVLPDEGRMADVVDQLAACFGRTFTPEELTRETDVRAALRALATESAPAFQSANPDQPGVYYQSWAGVSRAIGGPRTETGRAEVLAACDGLYRGDVGRADFMAVRLVPGSFAVGKGGAPHDGMVTVESAKWGNFRGCFPGDHLDEVGQPGKTGPNGYTGFDHIAFYRTLVADLAARGF